MLTLVCAAAFVQAYAASEIAKFPVSNEHIMAPYTWAGVLLDDGTVAGYHADSTGVHGESFLAKAFVVDAGKLIWLPRGGNEYSRVFGGRGSVLVGTVSKDGEDHPAMWKPNPTWAQAKLTVLSHQNGWAQFVAPSGAIWMRVDKEWRSTDPRQAPVKVDYLDLYGADRSGRIYGNLFKGYGEGFRRQGSKPAMYDGRQWTNLPCTEAESRITAVNARGVAVGCVGTKAAMWKSGRLTYLPCPNSRFSEAVGIDDSGEIVGYFMTDQRSHACLWKDGRLVDLSKAANGDTLAEAVCINSHGQMVAVNDRGSRLFLLTPK